MLRRPCITEREKWNSPSEVTHYPYYSIALLALGCAGAMPGALVAAGAAETETGFLTLIHTPQATDASGHAYAPARGAHTPLGHLGAPPPTWSVISPVLAWGASRHCLHVLSHTMRVLRVRRSLPGARHGILRQLYPSQTRLL